MIQWIDIYYEEHNRFENVNNIYTYKMYEWVCEYKNMPLYLVRDFELLLKSLGSIWV